MSETHPLTPGAHARLLAELEDLTGRGRIEIAEKIERARELGDLSENGDYHAAKEEQGHMEGRIRQLESILDHCEIVDVVYDGTVRPGSIVKVRYKGDGPDDVSTYFVGSIEEHTNGRELMSPASPLGQALTGARTGDTVTYETPTGDELQVEVVEVETP
ncbi:MAG: transcription elongation factor GreA [Actinomycetota bacterium]|nr:transcription elongation factor GreA [Actinomycetota bacterium]